MIDKANKLDMEILLSCILLVIVYNALEVYDTLERMLVHASIALLVTIVIIYVLKRLLKIGDRGGKYTLDKYTFPSFHTAIAFCLATVASFYNHWLVFIYAPLALIIAFARIPKYHNMLEVFVGGLIGVIISGLTYNFVESLPWYFILVLLSISLVIIIFNSERRK